MSMLLDILGVRLFLWMGREIPRPVAYDVMSALTDVNVTNDVERGDAFQLTFTLTRGRNRDFSAFSDGLFEPDSRVSIGVALGAVPHILIDGVIERYELVPEGPDRPGAVTVHGRSVLLLLDRETRNESHPARSMRDIVLDILTRRYMRIFPNTTGIRAPDPDPRATEQQRTAQQRNKTDLAYIRELGERAGFVFCAEYTSPGMNTAYWGPRYEGGSQPELTYHMGGATNLKSLSLAHDALSPLRISEGATLDTADMRVITAPGSPAAPSGLATRPAQPLRSQRLNCAARFDLSQVNALTRALQANAEPPVTGSGEIDSLRYGHVLRANRRVVIRGVGLTHNGEYQVSSVTHRVRRGEYTQSFRVLRDGTGSTR